jgi:hypothetical protein
MVDVPRAASSVLRRGPPSSRAFTQTSIPAAKYTAHNRCPMVSVAGGTLVRGGGHESVAVAAFSIDATSVHGGCVWILRSLRPVYGRWLASVIGADGLVWNDLREQRSL